MPRVPQLRMKAIDSQTIYAHPPTKTKEWHWKLQTMNEDVSPMNNLVIFVFCHLSFFGKKHFCIAFIVFFYSWRIEPQSLHKYGMCSSDPSFINNKWLIYLCGGFNLFENCVRQTGFIWCQRRAIKTYRHVHMMCIYTFMYLCIHLELVTTYMSHNHFLGFFLGSFQNDASRTRHKEDLPIKTLVCFPTKDP